MIRGGGALAGPNQFPEQVRRDLFTGEFADGAVGFEQFYGWIHGVSQ